VSARILLNIRTGRQFSFDKQQGISLFQKRGNFFEESQKRKTTHVKERGFNASFTLGEKNQNEGAKPVFLMREICWDQNRFAGFFQ